MATADTNMAGPLDAHVEIDEVILGGRRPKARKWENKTVVMGMLQRDGRIVAGPVPDQTTYTLEGIVNENVVEGSTISTDGGLNGVYDHGTVNHSAKEYVRGIYHVNNLESHWSLFQRAVKGTHVHISAKHAWKYISEFSYRRNMRHSHWSMFNLLVEAFALPRVKET